MVHLDNTCKKCSTSIYLLLTTKKWISPSLKLSHRLAAQGWGPTITKQNWFIVPPDHSNALTKTHDKNQVFQVSDSCRSVGSASLLLQLGVVGASHGHFGQVAFFKTTVNQYFITTFFPKYCWGLRPEKHLLCISCKRAAHAMGFYRAK